MRRYWPLPLILLIAFAAAAKLSSAYPLASLQLALAAGMPTTASRILDAHLRSTATPASEEIALRTWVNHALHEQKCLRRDQLLETVVVDTTEGSLCAVSEVESRLEAQTTAEEWIVSALEHAAIKGNWRAAELLAALAENKRLTGDTAYLNAAVTVWRKAATADRQRWEQRMENARLLLDH